MDKKKNYQEPRVRVVKVQVAHMMENSTQEPGGGTSRGYRSFDDED